MANSILTRTNGSKADEPVTSADHGATQSDGLVRPTSLALNGELASGSVDDLNQLLADTLTTRDLYKKHHWQASGPSFYILHLLFDKHFEEQSSLADLLGERVQTLGGVSIATAQDVVETTLIPRAPRERENTVAQISRLLRAHEVILVQCKAMAGNCSASGDLVTSDLIVSEVMRTNELQSWFLAEHVQCLKP